MLKSFTRNYEDNSTEAGFEFTFYCDICQDGYRSSFVESETYKKRKGIRGLSAGASVIGGLFGGAASHLGYSLARGGDVLSERFEDRSPEWHKEHERAFELAQNEAQQHFHRCHGCRKWVCDADYNEDEGMCVECAPRQEIYVARAKSDAMRRNIDEKAQTAVVWNGEIESKTTVCPVCGKPAGNGKFCNNCGASMARKACSNCGAQMSPEVKFCSECGCSMSAPVQLRCKNCGAELESGAKFCGECGTRT